MGCGTLQYSRTVKTVTISIPRSLPNVSSIFYFITCPVFVSILFVDNKITGKNGLVVDFSKRAEYILLISSLGP